MNLTPLWTALKQRSQESPGMGDPIEPTRPPYPLLSFALSMTGALLPGGDGVGRFLGSSQLLSKLPVRIIPCMNIRKEMTDLIGVCEDLVACITTQRISNEELEVVRELTERIEGILLDCDIQECADLSEMTH